jgi:hypothetical protein
MNSLIQAFLNQLILFIITAVMHVYYFYMGRTENINPLNNKADLLLFIIVWFILGTYVTWKFNLGIFA